MYYMIVLKYGVQLCTVGVKGHAHAHSLFCNEC